MQDLKYLKNIIAFYKYFAIEMKIKEHIHHSVMKIVESVISLSEKIVQHCYEIQVYTVSMYLLVVYHFRVILHIICWMNCTHIVMLNKVMMMLSSLAQ